VIDYYDRAGNKVEDEREQLALWDIALRRVAETTVGEKWVSTVHVPLDQGFGEGPPLIFETMVFADKTSGTDLYQERYSTEDDARAGHEAVVERLRAGEDLG
jgi:hypothetical protein